jgi:hypothetical protein
MKVRLIAVAAAAVLTTACADFSVRDWWREKWETGGSWENPDVPWEQWERDRSECRLLAREEAERDYAIVEQGRPPEDYSRLRPLTTRLDRHEAQQREESVYARCLENRGYRRVQRAEKRPANP